MPKEIRNRLGPKGQTNIGKKAPNQQTKMQPKPTTAKTAALKMGEMMHSKVRKTVAMKTTKNKGAKKY